MQLEIKSELASNRYDGTLSYRDGHVQYCNMQPVSHDLHASFNASPSKFTLNHLVLTVASSIIQLEGNVHVSAGSKGSHFRRFQVSQRAG
jgi:hypothetical protein